MRITARPLALLAGATWLIGASTPALGAEVQLEGYYRARGRLFDTLSIDRSLSSSEGLSMYAQHRFWLRPKIYVNDRVGVFAEIRGLDGVVWGDQPVQVIGADGEAQALAFSDGLTAPTSDTDSKAPLLDVTLWRAWGEVHTDIGRFKVGRMPLHWGAGIWQNDGLGPNADYGDTTDRLMWEHEIQDVFVRVAVDTNVEGLINERDGVVAYNLAGAYRTERFDAGLQLQLRHQPKPTPNDRDFTLFTVDAAVSAELGPFELQAEGVGQFGGGAISEEENDVQVLAVGAVLRAQYRGNPVDVALEGGIATGDGQEGDRRRRTFTFDRDFNVALIMFEQPMPVLASANPSDTNGGRDSDAVLTGNALSNAMYIKPTVGREIIDDLLVQASFIAARVAKVPDTEEYAGRSSYGMEVDATVQYSLFEHVEVSGTFGMFFPGSYYREFSDDTFTDGFSGTVYGGELRTRIHF